jgi:hypothetical protein
LVAVEKVERRGKAGDPPVRWRLFEAGCDAVGALRYTALTAREEARTQAEVEARAAENKAGEKHTVEIDDADPAAIEPEYLEYEFDDDDAANEEEHEADQEEDEEDYFTDEDEDKVMTSAMREIELREALKSNDEIPMMKFR